MSKCVTDVTGDVITGGIGTGTTIAAGIITVDIVIGTTGITAVICNGLFASVPVRHRAFVALLAGVIRLCPSVHLVL
ncbi:hypothetical protein MPOCJGCO_4760 [Methylobacterium trifolii]|uniref:Uncharacterized protein n=1 Tax=Methylobacterium trifolii TaxID=1003092 RepID=A0ABQ4U629_9HYPH|nr:hypothetical protein MPOCJGCO_4760 [Methylobacterium trifolii]